MSDNLTRAGGSRYEAPDAAIMAAIVRALSEAPDDEIRAAFGLGDWRVVTDAHRARYGAYFAPKVYREMVEAMSSARLAGDLNIRGFAKFTKSAMRGELFPVSSAGPCNRDDMQLVDVTIAPGEDDYQGGGVSGVITGQRADLIGSVISYTYGDWGGVLVSSRERAQLDALLPAGLELASVRRGVKLVLDYGGLFESILWVVTAFLVWGVKVPGRYVSGGVVSEWDFEVVNGAPPYDGVFFGYGAVHSGFGPHQEVYWQNDAMNMSRLSSAAWVDRYLNSSAPGVLSSANVHRMAFGDKTIAAAGWAGCFPRKKWVVMTGQRVIGGVSVPQYEPVSWITRLQWMTRYDRRIGQYEAAGAVVPAELVGDRSGGVRYYTSFAPEFIEAINALDE